MASGVQWGNCGNKDGVILLVGKTGRRCSEVDLAVEGGLAGNGYEYLGPTQGSLVFCYGQEQELT